MFVALLTLLGVVNVSRGPNSSPGTSVSDAGKASSASKRASVDEANSIVPESYLPTPETRQEILKPLVRFYGPKLATLKKKNRFPQDVAEWLLKGALVDRAGDPKQQDHLPKQQDHLEFLIAIVPHPKKSGMAFRFDEIMLALELAMRRTGHVLDDYRIPWSDGSPDWSRPLKASGKIALGGNGLEADWDIGSDEESVRRGQHQPGLVLFRKYPRTKDDLSQSLVAVLLVADTPVRGVDPEMLTQALDLSLRRWELRSPARRKVLENALLTRLLFGVDFWNRLLEPPAIRVIGPNFSGSPSSIARSVDGWYERLSQQQKWALPIPAIRWISGVALAVDGSTLSTHRGLIDYQMVTHSSKDFNEQILATIIEQTSNRCRVAILSEETSGYGEASLQRTLQVVARAQQIHHATSINYYTFPMNVAELRSSYEKLKALAQKGSDLKTAERLGFDSSADSSTPELIKQEMPGVSVPNDEMRLLRIAEDIRRKGIGHVIIQATDMRDVMFVSEFIRSLCANVRIYSITARQAYTHQRSIGQLRGLILPVTYPILLANQGWSGATSNQHVVLPNHEGYGAYNATMAQMIELADDPKTRANWIEGLLEYGRPYHREAKTPPIWFVVASQQGYYPLTVGEPSLVSEAPQYLWEPPDAPAVISKTQPVAAFRYEYSQGWLIVFFGFSAVLILLAVAYLLHIYVYNFFGFKAFPKGKSLKRWMYTKTGMRRMARRKIQPGEPTSFTREILGFSSLRRKGLKRDSKLIQRRKSWHAYLFGIALTGYLALSSPVWAMSSGKSREHMSPLELSVSVCAFATGMAALFAAAAAIATLIESWSLGLKKDSVFKNWKRWFWLIVLVSVIACVALCFYYGWVAFLAIAAIVAWIGIWSWCQKNGDGLKNWMWTFWSIVLASVIGCVALRRSGQLTLAVFPPWCPTEEALKPEWTRFLEQIFCLRATAMTSGVSPFLPIFLLTIAGMLTAYYTLRGLWVVWGGLERGNEKDKPVKLEARLPLFGRFYSEMIGLRDDTRASCGETVRRHPVTAILGLAAGLMMAVSAVAHSWSNGMVLFEPGWIGFLLIAGLLLLIVQLAWQITRLAILWASLNEATSSAIELPMAHAFGRLPRELTRKFGSYLDAVLVEGTTNSTMLQTQQANVVKADLRALAPWILETHASPGWACVELLLPVWSQRTVSESFSGPTDESNPVRFLGVPESKRATQFVERAETYLAMEIVRVLNHYLVACWLRVTLVTILGLLLLMVVNSYPFQPAGWIFGMVVLEVLAAALVVIWMMWGFQRNALIRRVKGGEEKSAFNLEFLGNLLTYVGPLVAGLIAVFSFTASDILRVMFGSLL